MANPELSTFELRLSARTVQRAVAGDADSLATVLENETSTHTAR
ncbi:hypothetical protein [Natronorubrum sp. A-ect3]